jgi:hypothetical protein
VGYLALKYVGSCQNHVHVTVLGCRRMATVSGPREGNVTPVLLVMVKVGENLFLAAN